jgi:hypothetical protein
MPQANITDRQSNRSHLLPPRPGTLPKEKVEDRKGSLDNIFILRGDRCMRPLHSLIFLLKAKWINTEQPCQPERQAYEIVSMLKDLINPIFKSQE